MPAWSHALWQASAMGIKGGEMQKDSKGIHMTTLSPAPRGTNVEKVTLAKGTGFLKHK
jgi:hypothetical protein